MISLCSFPAASAVAWRNGMIFFVFAMKVLIKPTTKVFTTTSTKLLKSTYESPSLLLSATNISMYVSPIFEKGPATSTSITNAPRRIVDLLLLKLHASFYLSSTAFSLIPFRYSAWWQRRFSWRRSSSVLDRGCSCSENLPWSTGRQTWVKQARDKPFLKWEGGETPGGTSKWVPFVFKKNHSNSKSG